MERTNILIVRQRFSGAPLRGMRRRDAGDGLVQGWAIA